MKNEKFPPEMPNYFKKPQSFFESNAKQNIKMSNNKQQQEPETIQPEKSIQELEKLLANDRYELDKTIIQLFNHFKNYHVSMTNLFNQLNKQTNEPTNSI